MSKVVDPETWRATRNIREAITNLHKTYSLHMKDKHQWPKVCLCPEVENYTRAYAFYKSELMRALYPPDPIDKVRAFELQAKIMDLVKNNTFDEETVKRILEIESA